MPSKIKLIIEKGPREGETLEYNSTSVIKIGRVVRGNTIAIKDAGISSKHISIQFDNKLLQWTLIDLDSSNGTIVNGVNVKPCVSSGLSDGDCVKIGDFTSMIVRIGTESEVVGRSVRRNTRRNGNGGGGVVESELGFDEGKAVEEVAQKRNLLPRGRKVAAAVVENEKEKAVEIEVGQKRDLRRRGKKDVEVERDKAVAEDDVQKRDLRRGGKKDVEVERDKVVVEEDLQKRDLRAVDCDCNKIGELTSMIDRIGTEFEGVGPSERRNTRQKAKDVAIVESELGIGVDAGKVARKRNLSPRGRKVAVVVENEKEKAVEVEVGQKRDLRCRGKKDVEVEREKGVVEEDLQKRDLRAVVESDCDCIKIGELTSMIDKIGTEFEGVGPSERRNTRQKAKDVAIVESELGLGVDAGKVAQKRNLRPRGRKVAAVVGNEKEKAVEVEVVQKREVRGRGKKGVEVESEKAVVEEDVQERDLRARGKRGVDVKIEARHLSCKRVLRSSKKNENLNVDVTEMGEDVSVLMERKKTRGGRKKLPVKVVEGSDLDRGNLVKNGVSVEGKRTGRGRLRKKMVVESLEENNAEESVQVGEGNKGDFDEGKADLLKKVENMGLVENLDANNKFVQDHLVEKLDTNDCFEDDLVEKLVLRDEGCEGKEGVVDGRLIKSPSEIPDMDMGKKLPVKGIPNTNRKYREDNKVIWHDTPFEIRLDRALNRAAAEASSRASDGKTELKMCSFKPFEDSASLQPFYRLK